MTLSNFVRLGDGLVSVAAGALLLLGHILKLRSDAAYSNTSKAHRTVPRSLACVSSLLV